VDGGDEPGHDEYGGDAIMSAYKSEFLNVLASRRLHPSGLGARRARCRWRNRRASPAISVRLHRPVAACRLAVANHAALLAAADRPSSDRAHGRRHHAGRRSLRQGRKPQSSSPTRTIAANLKGIRAIFSKFLKFGNAPGDALMANNADWLNNLNYVDFLRDVGRHFSVNRMLSFDAVKLRLDRQQELSFLEFNYMICRPMISSSSTSARTACCRWAAPEQWGNIRQRHRARTPDAQRALVCADLAADHHLLGRQDGQDRGRCGCGSIRIC